MSGEHEYRDQLKKRNNKKESRNQRYRNQENKTKKMRLEADYLKRIKKKGKLFT